MSHSCISCLLILLLVVVQFVDKSLAVRCYICGNDEDGSLSCSDFQPEDSKFIKDCGRLSQSCLISRKLNDNNVLTRSCEDIRLEDCKSANFIEYCYCSRDLCNRLSPSDDEDDFIEGSGKPSIGVNFQKNKKHQSATGKETASPEKNDIDASKLLKKQVNIYNNAGNNIHTYSWIERTFTVFLVNLYLKLN